MLPVDSDKTFPTSEECQENDSMFLCESIYLLTCTVKLRRMFLFFLFFRLTTCDRNKKHVHTSQK